MFAKLKTYLGRVVMVVLVISMVGFVIEMQQVRRISGSTERYPQTYLNTIASVAKNKTVMLAIVDSGFLDMVINLFVSSIKPLGITNFVILATDDLVCPALVSYGITCALYRNFHLSKEASIYGSREFNAKMSIRSQIIIDVLSAGFTVLHTDTDLYFYKNPFDHIHCPRKTCHMAALYDYVVFNAGFVLLHPNAYSISLYKQMISLQRKEPELTEQKRFNNILQRIRNRSPKFVIVHLPDSEFRCGKFFDSHKFVETSTPCSHCVVVHNNWIKGMHEKILRAKEMQLWMFDKNGYYSDPTRKYLTYENPAPRIGPGNTPISTQMNRLARALKFGVLLNRTVILPKFYIDNNACPLLEIASISALDCVFGDAYRERSFLLHPLVPQAVKDSTSLRHLELQGSFKGGINDSWILDQFQGETASVLHLGKLDHDVIFSNLTLRKRMQRKITAGLKVQEKLKEKAAVEVLMTKMKETEIGIID